MELFSPQTSCWCEVTNGCLTDLPLQRLSHSHRGWQTAIDGFWSLPPGDVFAGCRTDTQDTWIASEGEAAPVPAPRYHGNQLCNETLAHLDNSIPSRKRKEKKRGQICSCDELWWWNHHKRPPLTHFMFSWVVWDLKGIQFKPPLRLSYVVNARDVGAHFINHLHELRTINKRH